MVKVVALLKRRPGLTHAEFSEYYRDRHAPLFRSAIPPSVNEAIVHYVQNHALELSAGSEAPYDCVTEMGFRDLAGMRVWADWYAGADGKVLRDDEELFLDRDARVVIVTESY